MKTHNKKGRKVKAWAILEEGKRIERTGMSDLYIFTTELAANRRVEEYSEKKIVPTAIRNWPKLSVIPITITYEI